MILAIDPSINKTGWCLLSGTAFTSGVIVTRSEFVSTKQIELANAVRGIIAEGGEGLQAVIEVPAPHAYGRTQGKGGRMINLDAMLKLARAVGAITLALAEGGVACIEVTPQEWKGARQKCWDRLWAEQQLGRRVRDDEADAIALAHWYTIRARGAR